MLATTLEQQMHIPTPPKPEAGRKDAGFMTEVSAHLILPFGSCIDVHVERQQGTSSKRRAPRPLLPSEYLKYPQNFSASSRSISSSSLLTPPVTTPHEQAASPPLIPEAEDYLNARKPKRRHHSRHARGHEHCSQDSDQSPNRLRTSRDSSPRPDTPGCDLCEAFHNAGANLTTENSNQTSPRELRSENPDVNQTIAGKRAGTFPSKVVPAAQNVSPAVESLRRLSQPHKATSSSSSGPIRRWSLALASALGITDTSDDQSQAGSSTATPTRMSTNYGRFGDEDGDLSTERSSTMHSRGKRKAAQGLGMPTTIFVRKASNVQQASTVCSPALSDGQHPVSQSSQYGADMGPPTVELVAFYSEHRQRSNTLSTITRTQTTIEPKRRTGSIAQLSLFGNDRRKSLTADVAVTYADVHIAPGTFSARMPKSEGTTALENSAQRVSAVQLRSPNSVHEIIWREDETTSGSSISCSTQGSSSPHRATQFVTIGGSSYSPTQLSLLPSEGFQQLPFLRERDSIKDQRHEDAFSSFSWNRPAMQPQSTHSRTNDSDLISRVSDPSLHRLEATERRGSLKHIKPSRSEGSFSAKSLPPLLHRKSTENWQAPPNANLNDSKRINTLPTLMEVRGKEHRAGNRGRGDLETDGAEESAETARPYNVSAHPFAPPRLWESGRRGSSVGASTHQSRPLHSK